DGVAVQGNLDPALCLAPWDVVEEATLDVLARAAKGGGVGDAAGAGGAGHVFNLGHGVLPETDPRILARVVDLVHEKTAQ
ncbi:MAG TPA: uroporphyrinogen decarboxylase family protein, partial [Acidimicrobiales bacterium]